MPVLAAGPVELHYQVAGEGEVIVLIHGLGANIAFWFLNIAAVLANDYAVITYDLRGHGRSSTPRSGYRLTDMTGDLTALLDHLKVERAHIVGHSFGARVAMLHAIHCPERVETLTIADTQVSCLQPKVRLRDWPHWPEWKKQLLSQGVRSLPNDDEYIGFQLLAHFNQLAPQITSGQLGGAAPVPRPRVSLRNRDMGAKGAARWQEMMNSTTAAQDLDIDAPLSVPTISRISAPTLALFGEYSHCLPTCDALQRLIPNCQVTIVPKAGHFHPAIRPGLFVRYLRRFLSEQTGKEVSGVYQGPRRRFRKHTGLG